MDDRFLTNSDIKLKYQCLQFDAFKYAKMADVSKPETETFLILI